MVDEAILSFTVLSLRVNSVTFLLIIGIFISVKRVKGGVDGNKCFLSTAQKISNEI